ncbi:MAG: hypothetical protein ACTSR2_04430 [Candidatus Hodarchaeales archaeon]
MDDNTSMTRYLLNIVLGFIIGFGVFCVLVLGFIIIFSLDNIGNLLTRLPILMIIFPVMLLMYFEETITHLEFLQVFIWEFVFLGLILGYHYFKKRLSDKERTIALSVLVIMSLLPFLYLQLFGLPAIMSDALTNVYNFFNFPRDQGVIKFIQIYWGIPVWFISWMNLWVSRLHQTILKREKVTPLQWLSLVWVIGISLILLWNKVHLIMVIP